MKNSKSGESGAEGVGSEIKGNLEDEVDALFKLPIAEFTGARNDLAARLKGGGQADDAKVVKALAKPSVTAWAVNQLYWNHREAFDRLLAAGQRFHKAQTSGAAGQILREALEARREALSDLSELAASLLSDGGHNPTPDALHRITTTLESLSAYASLPDGPAAGRLSRDVDPPGFEALASLVTDALAKNTNEETRASATSREATAFATSHEPADIGTAKAREEFAQATSAQEPGSADRRSKQEPLSSADDQRVRQLEEAHKARIAAARVSLLEAEKQLAAATDRAQQLEAAQKKADAEANRAEQELREAEERLKKATADSRDAAERSQSVAAEAQEASRAVEDATSNMEKASKELELLFQESEPR